VFSPTAVAVGRVIVSAEEAVLHIVRIEDAVVIVVDVDKSVIDKVDPVNFLPRRDDSSRGSTIPKSSPMSQFSRHVILVPCCERGLRVDLKKLSEVGVSGTQGLKTFKERTKINPHKT